MKNVSIIFPYCGDMNQFHVLSINQIAMVDGVDVHFIGDEKSLRLKSTLSERVFIHDIADVFNTKNIINVKIDDIKKYPYKLCDLKPFFSDIFNIPVGDFWGFGDLDCIYNSKRLTEVFAGLKNKKCIYGDRGHLMLFGSEASAKIQDEFFGIITDFKKENINLLAPEKGYALDEFRFLHKILLKMEYENILSWNRDFFKPYFDVDYKNITPKNYDSNKKYSFTLRTIFENNTVSPLSYIHLQKRKIRTFIDISNDDFKAFLTFSCNDGFAVYSSEHQEETSRNVIKKSLFKYRVLYRRIKYRLSNYGLGKRPGL